MTKPLSPSAQAVLDAADEVFARGGRIRDGFAAALRVVAYGFEQGDRYKRAHAGEIRAIAAELEAQ